MTEKFSPTPLKDIVRKPEFSDIYGLKDYLISILDESEKRDSLDIQGLFEKGRKKTLGLGWKQAGFERNLVIKDSKDKKTVYIGIELKCLNTNNGYIVEQYEIFQKRSRKQTEDLLCLSYKDNLKEGRKITLLYSKKTRASVLRMKGLLSRAINHSFI